MTFRIVRDRVAQIEIGDFAHKQFSGLKHTFTVGLGETPNTWSYFYVAGAPYRTYFFGVGRRTNYCVIYTVDEEAKTVDVLRFWKSAASRHRLSFDAQRLTKAQRKPVPNRCQAISWKKPQIALSL